MGTLDEAVLSLHVEVGLELKGGDLAENVAELRDLLYG